MRSPFITVVIPVYKAEKYIRRCLDSVRAQSFSDFEAVLIDDGSPDGSGAICDEYAKADPRFRVIHQPNGGVSSARNAGLENAKGLFLASVDPDDYVGPDFLLHMAEAQKRNDADLVIARCVNISAATGRTLYVNPERGERFFPGDQIPSCLPQLWLDKRSAAMCLHLFRVALVRDLRIPEDITLGEDAVFFCMTLPRVRSLELTDARDYFYIKYTGGSLSSQNNAERYLDFIRIHELNAEQLTQSGLMSRPLGVALNRRMAARVANAITNIRRSAAPLRAKRAQTHALLTHPSVIACIRDAYAHRPLRRYGLMLKKRCLTLLLLSAYEDLRGTLFSRNRGTRG